MRRIPLAIACWLSGCTVGPNFVHPADTAPAHWWGSDPPPGIFYGGEVDAAWWTSFHDPELSSLVQRLVAQNLDLQAAAERVRQGRAQRDVVRSEGLPHLDADGSYRRERQSLTGPISLFEAVPGAPKDFDDWRDALSASWELDLFGRVRRATEAASADTEAAVEARHALALAALAELAQDYFQLRGTQALEVIAGSIVADADRNLALVRSRFSNGVATTLDVAQAQAQRANVTADLPRLRATEARLVNAIGLLLAEPPRRLAAELAAPSPLPVPPVLASGLPSELARRRPDIREAEARLHAATARTGVAVASFYPDVRLVGTGGTESLQFRETFNLHSSFFEIGPSVDVPLFEGGRLQGTLHLRESQQREAALRYRSTVLRAWQEVDDAMTSYAQARQRQAQLTEAVQQDRMALTAARQRYAAGAVDFLNVVSNETALLRGESALANAATETATAAVSLFKALGGGWTASDAAAPP